MIPARFREHLPWPLGGHEHRKLPPGSTATSSRLAATPSWRHDRWAGNKMAPTEPRTDHRIGASRPAGHHARRVGAWLSRRLFCPLAASPASPVIDHRRPTRCIAMRCRPHRERAHLPTGSSWIVAALAPSSVVRTARPVTPTVKLVAVTARGEQEPRPGRLDAAGARGRTPGRPGCRPGAQGPRRSGDGRQPGLIHRLGLRLAAVPRNAGAAARRVRPLPSR